MIAMVFAICYQSLHIFIDSEHHHSYFSTSTKNDKILKNKVLAENDDCPVCEFGFAAFLLTEVFTYKFVNPLPKFYFIDNYSSIVKKKEFLCYSHRGPPLF